MTIFYPIIRILKPYNKTEKFSASASDLIETESIVVLRPVRADDWPGSWSGLVFYR